VCAEPDPPAAVIEEAQARGARLLRIGHDFGYDEGGLAWRYWGPGTQRTSLPHPALRGAHQLGNAAAALCALGELRALLPVDMQSIRAGLVGVSVPARFQVLPGRPAVILDVAHNPHAARALARTLRHHSTRARTLAVFGMLADKDAAAVVEAQQAQVDAWYVATLAGARGAQAATRAPTVAQHDPGKPVHTFACPQEAYRSAAREARDDDRIVVFGSFLTVSDVLSLLQATPPGRRMRGS
jgi:dihydrofolate synthase/folylpolyglutamate synthase